MRPCHLLVACLLLAGATLSSAAEVPAAPEAWAAILAAHLERYPRMAAEDLYKLAHQSVFGPAHLIPDREAAGRYLDQEAAALTPGPPDEPLVEPIGTDPSLVRVNLRPFFARGGSRNRLLDALVASADTVQGDPRVMASRLASAARELHARGREADADALADLVTRAAAAGYPAGHHSVAYREAYRPAYRVVLLPLIEASLPPTREPAPGSP